METLKKINRTLLEVWTAILFWTLAVMGVGMLIPLERWQLEPVDWFLGVFAAGAMAAVSIAHMYRCLDRALDLEQGAATKMISSGYIIRYTAVVAVIMITAIAGVLNPVITCLGYWFIMKVSAYSQPFTHKLYNKLFHETDPIAEPLVEHKDEAQSMDCG